MNELQIQENETKDDFLLRLGDMKQIGMISLTWAELAKLLNAAVKDDERHGESWWRKRYHHINESEAEEDTYIQEEPKEDDFLKSYFNMLEKQRIRIKDERMAYNRSVRKDARREELLDLLRNEIRQAEPVPYAAKPIHTDRAVYALLSDIHYGIAFSATSGQYNTQIAKQRVMSYAERIIDIADEHKADICYVSLLGDLISGGCHQTIRIENEEDVVSQVIGVSELISAFLFRLAERFHEVRVNWVDGNHSRIVEDPENALIAEKLDTLIPWYAKTKLERLSNIFFESNAIDSSIANFRIFGRNYISVHGDMDNDLSVSCNRIEKLIGQPIDYFLAGHLHIADLRFEHTGFIRNGSVCGSGDQYTMKKRLFGPACQVTMIVTENGVEAVYPVRM